MPLARLVGKIAIALMPTKESPCPSVQAGMSRSVASAPGRGIATWARGGILMSARKASSSASISAGKSSARSISSGAMTRMRRSVRRQERRRGGGLVRSAPLGFRLFRLQPRNLFLGAVRGHAPLQLAEPDGRAADDDADDQGDEDQQEHR